jgi:hypothetical protein
VGRGLRRRDDGGNVNNVQWNCHYEPRLYNEYILIKKIYFKKSSSYYNKDNSSGGKKFIQLIGKI